MQQEDATAALALDQVREGTVVVLNQSSHQLLFVVSQNQLIEAIRPPCDFRQSLDRHPAPTLGSETKTINVREGSPEIVFRRRVGDNPVNRVIPVTNASQMGTSHFAGELIVVYPLERMNVDHHAAICTERLVAPPARTGELSSVRKIRRTLRALDVELAVLREFCFYFRRDSLDVKVFNLLEAFVGTQ